MYFFFNFRPLSSVAKRVCVQKINCLIKVAIHALNNNAGVMSYLQKCKRF